MSLNSRKVKITLLMELHKTFNIKECDILISLIYAKYGRGEMPADIFIKGQECEVGDCIMRLQLFKIFGKLYTYIFYMDDIEILSQ